MGFNSAFKGLKSEKNNGHLIWRRTYIYVNILRWSVIIV